MKTEKIFIQLDRELKTISNTLAVNSLKRYIIHNKYKIWIYKLKAVYDKS